MDPPRAGALTPREKTQLQEKLALLKRAYRRTFHRLQRAERAEKVKSYVKKTVAEQNLLLQQDPAGRDDDDHDHDAEPHSQGARGGPCGKALVGPGAAVSPTKPTSVSFKPEPEVFSPEDCWPQFSGSKHARQGCGKPCWSLEGSVAGPRQSQLSRRETRVPWRAASALEEREAATVSEKLQGNVGGEPECLATSAGSSQSPVFKRRRSSRILETNKTCWLAGTGGRGRDVTAVALEPEFSHEGTLSSLSHPLASGSSQASQGPSLDLPCEAAGFVGDGGGGLAESPVQQAGFQDGGKRPAPMDKAQEHGQMGEEDPGSGADSAAPRGSAPHAWPDSERTHQEAENSGGCNGASSVCRPSAQELGDRLEAGSPLLEGNPPAPSPKNVLSSCTVVEGLLYPVEYYVRMTRRMSSCQREVNVEAVVQSQLGKSRRGPRAPRREKAPCSVSLSSQEGAAGGEPGPALEAGGVPASPPWPVSPPCRSGAVSGSGLQRREGRPSHRASSCTSQGLPETAATLPQAARCLPPGRKEGCHGEGKPAGLSTGDGANVHRQRAGRRGLAGPGRRGSRHRRLKTAPKAAPSSPAPESPSGPPAGSLSGESTLCLFGSQPHEQDGTPSQAGPKQEETASPPSEAPEAPLNGGRGCPPGGSPGATAPCLSRAHSAAPAFSSHAKNEEGSLFPWLPLSLHRQEFCLPDGEFGPLKLEKCRACPAKPPEAPAAREPPEGRLCAGLAGPEPGAAAGGEELCGGPVLSGKEPSPPPLRPSGVPGKGFPSSELLLSPAWEGGSCPQRPSPAFPLVGSTPASQDLAPSQGLSEAFGTSPSQVRSPDTAQEPGPFGGASPSPGRGTRRRPWKRGTSRQGTEGETRDLEERQSPAAESLKCIRDDPGQNEMISEGPSAEAPEGPPSEGRLQMTSQLKGFSGSRLVDVCTVQWEEAGSTGLRLVTATEAAVTLWRQSDPGRWEADRTWHAAKVPVRWIVPLPGFCHRLCVALGGLEVEELRFLLPSSEDGCLKQSLIKAGDIRAVLGLWCRRLVTSCGSLRDQEVEILSFSEAGRSHERQALATPGETLKAFAEVDGMGEALVGMTTANSVVVWNLASGQLLRRISVGHCYPASVCHRAYSDSGLLFVVLSHPHAKESQSGGNPAFWVVALNPKTARSLRVMALSLPPGTGGRSLSGEVRGASAAAVLTSGSIAVWDLLLGRCTALLPPSPEGRWSLARWSATGACLLAGQDNGRVCVYSYTSLHSV